MIVDRNYSGSAIATYRGRYQSGQMGQTVNLLATPSEVRILLSPLDTGESSSFGRAKAFQALGGGFESRLSLQYADVAQLVECVLGKDEVTSSNLVIGSVEHKEVNNKLYSLNKP